MPSEPARKKPTGQLIAAKRGREWATLIGWGAFLGLPFLLVLTSLNGHALLNAETKRKVELRRQIEQEHLRSQQLMTCYQQASASTKVMRWASKADMVRVEEQPAVLLNPVASESEPPIRNLNGSVLGALPD